MPSAVIVGQRDIFALRGGLDAEVSSGGQATGRRPEIGHPTDVAERQQRFAGTFIVALVHDDDVEVGIVVAEDRLNRLDDCRTTIASADDGGDE
jgi:hypothetical protein